MKTVSPERLIRVSAIVAMIFFGGLKSMAGSESKSVGNLHDVAVVADDKELGLSIHQVFTPDELTGVFHKYQDDAFRTSDFRPWLTNSSFVAIRLEVPVKGQPIVVRELVLVGNDNKLYSPRAYGIAAKTNAFVFTYPTPWNNASRWDTIIFPWVEKKEPRENKMLIPNVKQDDKLGLDLMYEVLASEKSLRIERRPKEQK